MPRYECFCHASKKSFLKVLSLVDYEEGEVLCPHYGGKAVDQLTGAGPRSQPSPPRRARDCTSRKEAHMHSDQFPFGTIRIDGSTCEHDVVIDRGEIRKRKIISLD